MFSLYLLIISLLIIISSLLVLISVSPIESILFLILTFIFSSLLFLFMGAEFLALLLLIVYVGAISILFLFVVMMLNLRLLEQYVDFFFYLPLGAFIGFFIILVFFLMLLNDFGLFLSPFMDNSHHFTNWVKYLYFKNNIWNFGVILYNVYFYLLILAGLILLVAMIGVIVLTVDFSYRSAIRELIKIDFNSTHITFSFWSVVKQWK